MVCKACGRPCGLRYWLSEALLLGVLPLHFLTCLWVWILVTWFRDGNPIKQFFWRRGMLGVGRYVYVTFPCFWHTLRCGGPYAGN